MPQITLYAKTANQNWDDANAWNTAADGSGTDYTNPQNGGGNTFICNLNGKNPVVLNVDVAVDEITNITASASTMKVPNSTSRTVTAFLNCKAPMLIWGTGTCSLTVNGNVTYDNVSTSGALAASTGQSIIINGVVTQTGNGYCIVTSGSAVLTISNVGGNAIVNSAGGRGVSHGSTGTLTVTGKIVNKSSGTCLRIAAACTSTISGDVESSGTGNAILVSTNTSTNTITGNVSATNGVGIYTSQGTTTLVGNATSSGSGVAMSINLGTVNWTGNRSLDAGSYCLITMTNGTLALAKSTEAMSLSCSGVLVINRIGGTLTLSSGGYTAELVRQTSTGQIAVLGVDASAYISGPTLPAAADVESGVSYGYAGDPQTGTFVGGSGGSVTIQICTNSGRIGVQEC